MTRLKAKFIITLSQETFTSPIHEFKFWKTKLIIRENFFSRKFLPLIYDVCYDFKHNFLHKALRTKFSFFSVLISECRVLAGIFIMYTRKRKSSQIIHFHRVYLFSFRLPDHVSCEEGALLEPLSVAVNACRRAQVVMGDHILICGAGTQLVMIATNSCVVTINVCFYCMNGILGLALHF